MQLNDIHFCFGYVLGKRDKFAAEFILNLKQKFTLDSYSRQELQRVLYKNQPNWSVKLGAYNTNAQFELRVFRFIKHTIRNHKNY